MGTRRNKKSKKQREEQNVAEDVDYAATADAFFNAQDNSSAEEGVSEDNDVSDSESEEESNESEDDLEESEDGAGAEESVDDEDDSDEMVNASGAEATSASEQCTYDLRNLLAVNTHQVDTAKLYSTKKKGVQEEDITIPPENMLVHVSEEYLLERAVDGCSQLISALWKLPVERSDVGPMVQLPLYDSSNIPRALPPPPPKKETKWEKFAKAKGIPLNKNKRSRKVWDETTGTWMFRHGYQKANDDSKEWPIMEVKGNADPYEDPWEKMREEKRARVQKNVESRMRNEERAGNLAKGTTTRVLKSRDKARQAGKAGGNMDRDSVPPTGIPVDLRPTKKSGPVQSSKRGKVSTMAALAAVQKSTASMGKFDKLVEGEPERKKSVVGLKKRKYESATDRKVNASETDRSMRLFKAVVEGGGAEKEKARKKGKLAKGETAFDYEYDDGLGPSTFRKKKGRAGSGKMKKMTKKRVK